MARSPRPGHAYLGLQKIFCVISPKAALAALHTALRELIAGGAPLEPPRGVLPKAPRRTLFSSRWWPKKEFIIDYFAFFANLFENFYILHGQ